jgi:hypothetical protein
MRLLAPLALLLAATTLPAQSARVAVDVAPGSAQALRLEMEGFVLEPVPDDSERVEIILPRSDLARLNSYGHRVQLLELSRPLRERITSSGRAIDGRFYDWGELNQKMLDFESAHPAIAKRVDLTALLGAPATHQGRHIYGLKISDNPGADEDEPNVLYVGNHHAREVGTPQHMVDWMADLCAGYGSDPQLTALIDQYEVWVVPTFNPDGLEHVWNVDEWWRKNRRNNGGGVYGVDLNRNYPFQWALCGSFSHTPSSDVYVGPAPGSEPETQTMLAFGRARRFVKVIDVHQSGREVLWGNACGSIPAAANDEVLRMRDVLASAASYATRPPSASGEHYQWEYAEIGALAYLIELDTTFFPTWTASRSEYLRVAPAYRAMLAEEAPLTGHVYDAATGQPIDDATITVAGLSWTNGEQRGSGGAFGRYHLWLRDGTYDLSFTAPGYGVAQHRVSFGAAPVEKDVFLSPASAPNLFLDGSPAVGSSLRFFLQDAAAYPNRDFWVLLSASGGGPFSAGIPVPGTGLVLDLDQDFLTQWSLGHLNLLGGRLGANGVGVTPWLTVPPAGAGLQVWAAAVISQGGSHQAVTPAVQFDVR